MLVLACLVLSACARPLTEAETAFAAATLGPTLDPAPVRLHKGLLVGTIPRTRPPRPHVACRERIWPEETAPVTGTTAGIVVGQRVFLARRFALPDFLAGYPGTLPLPQAMFLAHELTHVWQWQNRALTGYSPWKAAGEHAASADPYLFDVADRGFLDYPYEQQAALVEEFVCCRALDPEGARTQRLHDLLAPVFPGLQRSPAPGGVALPWDGAEVAGICSQ